MRVDYVALLVTTFLAITNAVSTLQGSKKILQPSFQRLPHSFIQIQDLGTRRFLRSFTAEDEERVNFPTSVIEKAKSLVTTATAGKLQTWLTKGKSIDDVFVRMQLTARIGDNLLDDPQFKRWLTYVDDFTTLYPGKTTSVIATLTTHYGDDGVAKILDAAKKVAGTRDFATKLETAQVEAWREAGKSADDVFLLLKLNKAGDDILSSPAFASWNAYLKIFKKTNPGDKTSVFAKLTQQYGEVGVSRVVEAALNVKSSSAIAKTVQAEQFERWMAQKQSTDDIFTLLGLDKAGKKLLENPLLNTFTKYVARYNKRYPDQETTVVGTLTSLYGDVGLAKLLAAGRDVPSTSKLVATLDEAQFNLWMGKLKTPDSVFTMLGLEKSGENLLTNPLFTTFTKFTDAYHAKKPGIKMTTNWIVRAHYDDFDVAKMILAAEKVPSAQSAAKRMEAVLFKDWMMNSPDDAFKALKLENVKPANFFKDPMFLYWMKFMDDFTKAVPGKNIQRTLLATSYKDQDVVNAVLAAKKNPSTKELADKLEKEMFKQFIFDEKQPLHVAKLMHVKEKTDVNWKLWKQYMQDYHKYHLREITTR